MQRDERPFAAFVSLLRRDAHLHRHRLPQPLQLLNRAHPLAQAALVSGT